MSLLARLFDGWGMTPPNNANVRVSEDTALTVSAFWRGATVIAETAAKVPLKVYAITPSGRDDARNHPNWRMLHDTPNDQQSTFDFLRQLYWDSTLWGNGYAEVDRESFLSPVARSMSNLAPYRVEPMRDDDGTYWYRVDGTRRVEWSDMVHVHGPAPEAGCGGYRLVQVAREAIGYALATEQYGSKLFANNLHVGGWFLHPGQLSEPARNNILESKKRDFGGSRNAGKWDILEEGMTAQPRVPDNEQAQYIEVRKQNAIAVLQYLGVPCSLCNILDRATWGNYTEEVRAFYQFCIDPKLTNLESEVNQKIIRSPDFYAEFVREGIVQLDPLTQAEIWKMGIDGGWLEANDIRRMMNLPPVEKPTPQPEVTNANL